MIHFIRLAHGLHRAVVEIRSHIENVDDLVGPSSKKYFGNAHVEHKYSELKHPIITRWGTFLHHTTALLKLFI